MVPNTKNCITGGIVHERHSSPAVMAASARIKILF